MAPFIRISDVLVCPENTFGQFENSCYNNNYVHNYHTYNYGTKLEIKNKSSLAVETVKINVHACMYVVLRLPSLHAS